MTTWCDWLPTEYITAARAAFEKNYGANKPLVNVESVYYGHGLVKPGTGPVRGVSLT
jgi:hypothetical protein